MEYEKREVRKEEKMGKCKIINLVVELKPAVKWDRYMTPAAGVCREILYRVIP